ncbi:hypothetical protein [Streptomyces mirabilis]|jgi:hypothetical protein|uniref:hypothetical protein n=1 Tax=Streptomyces mirabilis TaxID=68239 RepID=UPI0036D920D5
MRDYQAVVRVRHPRFDLAVNSDQLDAVTGALVDYGATAQLWPDVSEWTMTVRVPTLYDVAHSAGRAVQDAYALVSVQASVVRVDAWQVAEWDRANEEAENK